MHGRPRYRCYSAQGCGVLFTAFEDIKDKVSSFPENQKIWETTRCEVKNTKAKKKKIIFFKVNVDTAENRIIEL